MVSDDRCVLMAGYSTMLLAFLCVEEAQVKEAVGKQERAEGQTMVGGEGGRGGERHRGMWG